MTYFRLLLCSFFLFTSATFGFSAEASWPMFHGPKLDNMSQETGLLKSWPQSESQTGPPLLWKNDKIGSGLSGYSSVAIADGLVFTSGNTKSGGQEFSTVYCLDAQTGKTLWTYNNGLAWTDKGMHPGTRSTPTIDGDYVYDESPIGRLACLEKKTGKKVWDLNIIEEFGGKLPQWALAESVIIDGNNVICTPGGSKASVAALDKKTGKTVWTAPSIGECAGYATPMIFEHDGIHVVVTMTQKSGLGVDAKDGKIHFQFPHVTKYDINATIPYYFNGRLFVTSGYGTGSQMFQVNKTGDKLSVEKLWENKPFDNQHGGIVAFDGYVFGTTMNYRGGVWACVNLDDGKMVWNDRGVGKGSCTYAEGMIYGMSERDGKVALMKANPEKFEQISQFQLPQNGEGMFWAHPVVCGKRLYLRYSNNLYCFDIAEK